MKTSNKLFLSALLALGVSSAFASTSDRHLSNFRAISLSSSVDLFITQGSSESVKVEAPDEIQSRILTDVDNGTLNIHNKRENFNWDNWFGSHKKIAVYVTVKDINSINVSGSGDVFFKDGISTNSLKIKVSGSGDVTGKLEVKNLETSVSGSGDIKLSGHAETATVGMNGSGDFSARNLVTANTSIHISGSGDAEVNASNKLDASVSGSGDIKYTGSAQVSSHTSGSGEIRHY